MNILFLTRFAVSPLRGGTERVTYTVASGLMSLYDHKCFSAYFYNNTTLESSGFVDQIKLRRYYFNNQLQSFIIKNNIHWIIMQGEFGLTSYIRKVVKNTQCKIIAVHHFAPGWEVEIYSFRNIVKVLITGTAKEKQTNFIRMLFYPYFKLKTKLAPRSYRKMYQNAHKVILLSNRFISQFLFYSHLKDSSKINVIPNVLSFDKFISHSELSNKNKTVLIVSRLDENQKRLSIALKIWKEIRKNPIAINWKLKIVGEGPNLNQYLHQISHEKISEVEILGKQDPIPYYKEASIFMMTSKSEGWGLTLTEAQQFGCVPIAFDTYASLHDIISSETNGIIINKDNLNLYKEHLLKLMENKEYREKLALNAIESSKQFSKAIVIKKWNNILT